MIALGFGVYMLFVFIGVWIWLVNYRALQTERTWARAARDGRDKAYIVGTLDLRGGKLPRLAMVGIYSASADQLTSLIQSEFHFDIDAVQAESFHEARKLAERKLREYPHLSWALEAYEHPWAAAKALAPIEDYRKVE